MEYFEERPYPYHPDIQRALNMITMNNDSKAVGSYKYACFKYPSDVDVMERVLVHAPDKATACETIARRIRQMVIRLQLSSPQIYLSDFKAGRDKRIFALWRVVKRLKLQYGDPTTSIPKEIVTKLIPLLKTAVEEKALTSPEAKKLLTLSPPEVYRAVRERYLLRWTSDQLIMDPPSKKLPGGKVITLTNALCDNARLCKLDVWAPTQDGFVEVENVMEISFIRRDEDKPKPISRLFFTDYSVAICHEVRKAYRLGWYLKTVKRTWFLSKEVFSGDSYPKSLKEEALTYIKVISDSPLLKGGTAKLASASSKLKCAKNVISGLPLKDLPTKTLLTQIINGMELIQNSTHENMVMEALKKLDNEALKSNGSGRFTEAMMSKIGDAIATLTQSVDKIVNQQSHLWLKENMPRLFHFLKEIEIYGGKN